MLNYINAELYKLRHKKGLFLGVFLLAILVGIVLTPGFWVTELDRLRVGEIYVAFLTYITPAGLFIAPIFATLVFDDQHGNGTLKNEIVYGTPRPRAYVGKLLSAMLAGTVTVIVVIGWYLLMTLLYSRGGVPVPAEDWLYLGQVLLGAWMTWLAALSFTFFLLFTLKNTAAAIAIVYLFTIFCLPISWIYGVGSAEGASPGILYWFFRLCYIRPYPDLWAASDRLGVLFRTGAVTLGWVLGSAGAGLAALRRREIK